MIIDDIPGKYNVVGQLCNQNIDESRSISFLLVRL